MLSGLVAVCAALVFPAHGITRAVTAIARHASFTRSPLRKAARAGALCMVVRNEAWRPEQGDRVKDVVWRGPSNEQCEFSREQHRQLLTIYSAIGKFA